MKTDYAMFNADNLVQIKKIKSHSVNLILTDPPYNISKYSTGNIKFSYRSDINNDIAEWDKDFDPSNYKDEFIRILKPKGNILAFTSYNTIGRWHEVFDPIFDTFQFFIWHKTNPTPKFMKKGFLNSCEIIVCMWNKNHIWNFSDQDSMHNFYESPICSPPERLIKPKHPTQKPVELLKHLIKIASNEKDIVFDPFMGVGSVGVAALELKRKFIGIELDNEYFKATKRRFDRLGLVI